MIKSITPQGRYITVNAPSSSTYFSTGANNLMTGQMRYNPNNQNVEVYDGTTWLQMNMGYASVGLNAEAESLLDWAREQKLKQMAREQLIKTNPALQKAYEAVKRAEANFDLIEKFVEHDAEQGETVAQQAS